MSYNCIRIERERGSFIVKATDPEIEKANRNRSGKGDCCSPSEWKDPQVEYSFKTKAEVLTFVEKAIDIALPADDYTSAFDKLAKEAQATP